MPQPDRNFDSQEYRYGFQGQEKDSELKGEGLSVNYKYRMHDPRIGRFFAVDPLSPKYPHYSPYSFSGNKVIHKIELEGLEESGLWNAHYYARVAAQAQSNDELEQARIQGALLEKIYTTGIVTSGALATVSGVAVYGPVTLSEATLYNMLRGGATGGVINGSLSALDGDDPLDIVKNTMNGFISGAIVGPGGNGTKELIVRGAIGEAIGEYANQIFEKEFQGREDFDLDEIIKSGGVGAVSNLVAGKLLDKINSFIAKQEVKSLAKVETQQYRDLIAKELKTQFPNMKTSGRQFKTFLNETIKEQKVLIQQQGNQLRVLFEKLIDTGGEKLEEEIKKQVDNLDKDNN